MADRQHLTTSPDDFEQVVSAFGARIEAEVVNHSLDRARRDARLDAFLGFGRGLVLDARRDECGAYVAR